MDERVGLTAQVQWRDPLGRFVRQIREAGDTSAYDIAKEGAKLSRDFAPKKTRRLVRAIKAIKGLTGQARWVIVGDPKLIKYAASQEHGSPPHTIKSHAGGPLANKEEGFFARSGEVRHPGTKAIRFLERARLTMAKRAIVITRKNLPGGR